MLHELDPIQNSHPQTLHILVEHIYLRNFIYLGLSLIYFKCIYVVPNYAV